MKLKIFGFIFFSICTFSILGWTGTLQIDINESKKLKSNEKVQINGTNIVILIEGISTLRPPDKSEISLITLVIIEKQKKTKIIVEKKSNISGYKIYKNYKIIVEHASGLKSYCVLRIQKQN